MKANLNETTIRYEDLGTGPAILVLHDAPSNRDILQNFTPLAKAGYRVVVTHLDGLTMKKSGDPDPGVHYRNTLSLLNFLGIGRAVVFGIGLGGTVLLDVLDRSPERVAASSLVVGAEAARRIRQMSGEAQVGAALTEGRLKEIREELLSILFSAAKGKAAPSSFPRLRAWVESVRSRSIYCSAVHHRSALLAGLDVPPLIEEAEEGEVAARSPVRRASRAASRGWKKIRGMNAHLAALVHFLFPPEEEMDEDDVVSDLP